MTPRLSRRDWMKLSAAGVVSCSLAPWFAPLAEAVAPNPRRKRACILLWMSGGPSQMDTFDCKPGHRNGGPIEVIATSVPGIKISQHLPGVAKQMKHLSIIRSMSSDGPSQGVPHGMNSRAMVVGRLKARAQKPTTASVITLDAGLAGDQCASRRPMGPSRYSGATCRGWASISFRQRSAARPSPCGNAAR